MVCLEPLPLRLGAVMGVFYQPCWFCLGAEGSAMLGEEVSGHDSILRGLG